MKHWYLNIILLFFSVVTTAQIIPIENIHRKDGLPQANVYTILQDKQGFIWIGTEAGLGRYDGTGFKIYDTDDGLGGINIQSIIEDRNGDIWIGAYGGLSRFNWKEFKTYTSKDGLVGDEVQSLLEDKQGNIWIATTSGVSKFDGTKFITIDSTYNIPNKKAFSTLYKTRNGTIWMGSTTLGAFKLQGNKFIKYDTLNGLSDQYVFCFYEDAKGQMYIGTQNGLNIFDGKSFVKKTVSEGLPSNTIRSITHDRLGNIWIGTKEGIAILDKRGKYRYIGKENGLTISEYVLNLYEDKQGVLWIGTYSGGVYKFSNQRFQIFNAQHGLPNSLVRSIDQDDSLNIWIGTDGGVAKYNGVNMQAFTAAEGLAAGPVMCIEKDHQGNMWFGTFGSGASKYDGKTFTNYDPSNIGLFPYVWSMFQDKDSVMWMGTYSGGVYRVKDGKILQQINTQSDSMAADNIMAIYQDKKGNIWLGTYGEGVRKYDGKKFLKLTTDQGLANNNVFSIFEDNQGKMWFATENGISIFDGRRFQTIRKEQGLHSNALWLMQQDKHGQVWVGHQNGVERYNPQTKSVKYYGYQEGFLPIEVQACASFMDKTGNMWFGTIDGVVKYSPKDDVPNPFKPITLITGINLFNREVFDWSRWSDTFDYRMHLPVNLVLPYNENFVTFNYIGIHTESPSKVRYQYMLKGFDQDWQPLTSRREATYSNLPPGNYTFLLKARSAEGIWNEKPVEYEFKVDSPFWEKWWFYGSEVLLLIFLFTMSIYLNQRGANERLATSLIIISMLIVTEFLAMNIENFLETYTGGVPVVKLVLNVILALSFSPVENYISRWIRMRKYKDRLEKSFDRLNINVDDIQDLSTPEDKKSV